MQFARQAAALFLDHVSRDLLPKIGHQRELESTAKGLPDWGHREQAEDDGDGHQRGGEGRKIHERQASHDESGRRRHPGCRGTR